MVLRALNVFIVAGHSGGVYLCGLFSAVVEAHFQA
jgi:hypothetical protein